MMIFKVIKAPRKAMTTKQWFTECAIHYNFFKSFIEKNIAEI